MLFFMPCFSLVVRNLSARLRTLAHMQVKARRRLAALRTVAEKNEEVAQAITIDAVDNEAVEEVRYEAFEEVSATTKILGMFSAVYVDAHAHENARLSTSCTCCCAF